MRFLDEAMPLIALGWAIFPLARGTKLPAIPKNDGGRGVLDAAKDPDQIRAWAKRFPRANVGIACGEISRLTVIDFDPKNGAMQTVAEFKARKQTFPPTVMGRTPSGGWHLYYAYAPDLLNSKSQLGPGIDVRTTGGYVVAPPSVLADGSGYRWVTAPLGPDLPKMPTWAYMALKPKPQPIVKPTRPPAGDKGEALGRLTRFVSNAQNGQRNSCLYWAARRAAEGGMTDDGAKQALAEAAMAIGTDEKEAYRTVGSAFRAGRRLA